MQIIITNIAAKYVDSIREIAKPYRDLTLEKIKFDEYYLKDPRNEKLRFWVFADSLNKYTNEEELAANNKSNAIRFVAFKLLLKRDPHKAIKKLTDDIDNNDSVVVTRLDEGFLETLSSLRGLTRYIQGESFLILQKIYTFVP